MKFIIKWNAGYGEVFDTVEADDKDEALTMAYESWKGDAESQADYYVVGEWTQELEDEVS